MKVRIFRPATSVAGRVAFEAFERGCRACGDDVAWTDDMTELCDVAVHASGVKGGRLASTPLSQSRAMLIKRFDKRRIVIESPAIRPGYERVTSVGESYWRLSLGGFLYDEADYANDGSPPGRWERIAAEQGIVTQDFRVPRDGHVLIMLQKTSDASLRGANIAIWAQAMIDMTREYVDWPIVVRPHPREREAPPRFDGAQTSTGGANDWRRARAVVTYTSLSAIDSILRGLPTWAMDEGNLARPVANTTLARLTDPWFPALGAFEQWLWDLGYTQWTPSEIEEGVPWTRLKRRLSARN